MRGFVTGFVTAWTTVLLVFWLEPAPPAPRLIGHDCVGSGGDLFAMEESDFPPCGRIEANL